MIIKMAGSVFSRAMTDIYDFVTCTVFRNEMVAIAGVIIILDTSYERTKTVTTAFFSGMKSRALKSFEIFHY